MKKSKKSLLLFTAITGIIAIIFSILFVIRKETEVNYRVAEISEQSCIKDSECETPMEYLIQSNCPYTSKCLEKTCAVICPNTN